MHSIYIHIPFCNYKCNYCNFFVLDQSHPNFDSNLKQRYIQALENEITQWGSKLKSTHVKSIYFGGGTPLTIGVQNIIHIIEYIGKKRSLEDLEEINIELNPDPFDETLDAVRILQTHFSQIPRIRFSWGIQTFDDEVLQLAGRNYSFNNLKGYLRALQPLKQPNSVYNFDFIAFGTLDVDKDTKVQGGKGRNNQKIAFFEDRIRSGMSDSFSLYMLELFPGSKWHRNKENQIIGHSGANMDFAQNTKLIQCINPDDDKIMTEYSYLSNIIQDSGYHRYEVSNYAASGKNALHNSVYRTMQPYIGIGASASGFLYTDQPKETNDNINTKAIRYTNTSNIMDYISGKYKDKNKTTYLKQEDILYEKFMLGIRSYGISNIEEYRELLDENYIQKIKDYTKEGLITQTETVLKLTNKGMNVANRIIGELLK